MDGPQADLPSWQAALGKSLRAAGFPAPGSSSDTLIQIDYRDLMEAGSLSSRMPQVTTRAADEEVRDAYLARAEMLRSVYPQPRSWLDPKTVARVLQVLASMASPSALKGFVPDDFIELVIRQLKDVERYCTDEDYRAAVLNRVLDSVPSGDLIIIGHSLGSVIALDLMAFVPRETRVTALVTAGSPLAHARLRNIALVGQVPPLPFPHETTGPWFNLVDPRDPVTGFTGLSAWWSEVVDVTVANPIGDLHGARSYLRQEQAGEIIGPVRTPEGQAVVLPDHTPVFSDGRGTDLTLAAITVHWANRIAEEEPSAEVRARARVIVRDLLRTAQEQSRQRLTLDRCSELTWAWADSATTIDRVRGLLELAASDPFHPWEPGLRRRTSDRALEEAAVDLRLSADLAKDVMAMMEELEKVNRGWFGRWRGLLVAAALAATAFVAAPVAVGAFAASGATGAAALTSGLAALGTGGMGGGIAAIGALSAGGASLAVSQLASGAADSDTTITLLRLIALRVRVLRRWCGSPGHRAASDDFGALQRILEQLKKEREKHETRSKPRSRAIQNLERTIAAAEKLLEHLEDTRASDEMKGGHATLRA